MGDKVPSVRTLDTGEKVTNYPDGRNVLVPANTLGGQLADVEADQTASSDAQLEQRLTAVEDKRAAQQAGDAVPADKSVL